jgi:hypothetical protein
MVTQSPLFLIRRGRAGTISGILPATAAVIGRAMKIGSKDAATGENTFVVADGHCHGFLTRSSRVGKGSTDAELVDASMGLDLDETPFEVSKPGSIEFAEAIEVEGTDYILTSGTGQITADTTAGTKLSFDSSGKFIEAQAADYAQFMLVAQMTPVTTGNVRIYIEAIEGYVVPS